MLQKQLFWFTNYKKLLTSKLILNDYPDYGLRVYGLLLVPKLNGFVCLPRGYIDVCFRVLLVIPKWSDTTLKALILGSPVPMNTFTEEPQNEPILEPLPTFQLIMVPIGNSWGHFGRCCKGHW